MSTPLLSKSIAAPGFKGLNTQLQGSYLDISWASEANNCIVDRYGRLSARKGWLSLSTVTGKVKQIYEYINATGAKAIISSASNKLYTGTTSLTDITGTLTPTADNWKFQNFNGKVVGWQAGHDPIYYTGTGSFTAITNSGSGTMPKGNEVLASWGRLWAFDSTHTVIRYSDLLIYNTWDDDSTPGSAGSIDLKSVWSNGMDRGVALAAFNGYLIIFGTNNILIYSGADDPGTTLALVEDIRGIGCLCRDSVQNVGTDLIWLSPNGLESFGRVVQEKSLPYSNLSKNVRNELSSYVGQCDVDDIRSTYYPKDGLYLLSLVGSDRVYVFDMKGKLPDGTVRVTTWSSNVPYSMLSSSDQTLYLGQDGAIGSYSGTDDNNVAYKVSYYSGWVNLNDDNAQMILKKLGGIVLSESGTVVFFKWAFDFSENFATFPYTVHGAEPSEWGEAEWGIGEWSGGINLSTINFSGSKSGSAIMIGIEVTTSNLFAIQRLDLKVKKGRIL